MENITELDEEFVEGILETYDDVLYGLNAKDLFKRLEEPFKKGHSAISIDLNLLDTEVNEKLLEAANHFNGLENHYSVHYVTGIDHRQILMTDILGLNDKEISFLDCAIIGY